ncbi:MAG: LptF/LptG family permease [Candidatus Omnitrophica bacterium]|nr:LptF/LptG family permease [Candidatus Omnitrophota bacterium]
MKITTRYMLKELGGPFISALFLSTVILAAGNIIQTADMVVNKGVEIGQVLKLFFLFLPYVLIFTIPISVLAAVLLGFGRMSSDNEITALRTSGISIYRLILPAVICGFIMSLTNVPLNDRILPESEFEARKLAKTLGVKHPTAMLQPGVFVKGFKDYIIFVHDIKGNKLNGVRIYQPQENGPTRTVVAEKGEVMTLPDDRGVKLKLMDGTADEIDPSSEGSYYKLSFEEYFMTLNLARSVNVDHIQKKAREKSIKELMAEIDELGDENINALPLKVELHKKLALAFSNLVFVLIGIPLAITTHRREKFIGFGLAIVLFLIYWSIMLGGIAFAIRGLVPAWAGVWSANILVTVLAVILFSRVSRK